MLLQEYSAKVALMCFIIMIVLSVILWYRNYAYDRIFAVFIFILSLIQIIQYGIHNNGNPAQGVKAIFLALWLQGVVLSIGVFLSLRDNRETPEYLKVLSLLAMIFTAIVFIVALIFLLITDDVFDANIEEDGQVSWWRNGNSLLNGWGWLYFVTLIIPLLVLLASYSWSNMGLIIILAVMVITAVYAYINYSPAVFGSVWCLLGVILAFVVWTTGMFR